MTVITIALAAARLVRAWLHEQIAEPLRIRLMSAVAVRFETDGIRVRVVDTPRIVAIKEWLDDLIDCPHCLGFWFALACSILWRYRSGRILVEALAASALVSGIVERYAGFEPASD